MLQDYSRQKDATRINVANTRGHCDEHIHVGGTMSNSPIGLNVKVPTTEELHGRREHKHYQVFQRKSGQENTAHVRVAIRPAHFVHKINHRNHAWSTEHQRDQKGTSPLLDFVSMLEVTVRHFVFVRQQVGLEAELLDAFANVSGASQLVVEFEQTPFGGESDGCVADAVDVQYCLLDFGHTRRASHAVDFDFDLSFARSRFIDHFRREAQVGY